MITTAYCSLSKCIEVDYLFGNKFFDLFFFFFFKKTRPPQISPLSPTPPLFQSQNGFAKSRAAAPSQMRGLFFWERKKIKTKKTPPLGNLEVEMLPPRHSVKKDEVIYW